MYSLLADTWVDGDIVVFSLRDVIYKADVKKVIDLLFITHSVPR